MVLHFRLIISDLVAFALKTLSANLTRYATLEKTIWMGKFA